MNKKFKAIGATLCAGLMCVPFAACGENDASAAAYVSMDINPSIEFTLDKNDKVISVHGANEDGQVLLYGENGIIGADIETAIEKVTNLAVELGYLDKDNSVVQTDVISKNGATQKLLEKVNAKITATAGGKDLSVTCGGAEAYSLLRKLENLKAQYPESKAIQALTPEKLKIVISASEAEGITIEAAAEMDDEELIKAISEAHTQVKEYATSAYNKAKSAADGVYQKAVSAATDVIYTTYYTTRHPDKLYYGLAYQGFKTGATAMRVLSDTLYYAEQISDYPLNEAQISEVSAALGLGTNVDALKNSDGEITVKSIEAYADKQFKNSEAADKLNELKAQLTQALNTVESELRTKIEEASAKYESEINAIKTATEGIADSIKALGALVPASVKEQINAMVADFNEVSTEIAAIISDGKITSAEVKTLSEKLNKKAASALEKIEADLTEAELEEVKALQQKATDALNKAKEQFDKAVADAEAQAKQKLEQLKAARKDNK